MCYFCWGFLVVVWVGGFFWKVAVLMCASPFSTAHVLGCFKRYISVGDFLLLFGCFFWKVAVLTCATPFSTALVLGCFKRYISSTILDKNEKYIYKLLSISNYTQSTGLRWDHLSSKMSQFCYHHNYAASLKTVVQVDRFLLATVVHCSSNHCWLRFRFLK